MTMVKICGLHTMRDIDYVNQAQPDFAGFVFADFSSRYVTSAQAAALSQKLDKSIIPVGVFWDHPICCRFTQSGCDSDGTVSSS